MEFLSSDKCIHVNQYSTHPSYPVSFTGIFGMDFYIILIRPGYRVARRKIKPGRIGTHHRVKKEDAIKWFQDKYEGIVL